MWILLTLNALILALEFRNKILSSQPLCLAATGQITVPQHETTRSVASLLNEGTFITDYPQQSIKFP